MKFETLLGKSSNAGRGYKRNVKNGLAYSIYKWERKGCKGGRYQVVFYVGINLMKKARIVDGDKIDILKSDDGQYGLIRRNNNGRVISCKQTKNCGRVSTTYNEEFPWVDKITTLDNVIIDEEGILFNWPGAEIKED